MISRELFKAIIEKIKTNRIKENKLKETLEEISDANTYCDVYLYSSDEDLYVNILEESVDWVTIDSENPSPIDYFIYELDFGAAYKEGCWKDKGVSIDLSDVDKLYDYCVKEKEKM